MTLHGVFMEILGLGVLVCGASGVGKGELALELVTRGHRLIADDAPEFRIAADSAPQGRCPPLLQDRLEVRGLGVLNIRALFGDTAIAPQAVLALKVHLQPNAVTRSLLKKAILGLFQHAKPKVRFLLCSILQAPTPCWKNGGASLHRTQAFFQQPASLHTLAPDYRTCTVLGRDIPEVTLPLRPGRNTALLIETLVRDFKLRRSGYDAAEDFVQRQRDLMQRHSGVRK